MFALRRSGRVEDRPTLPHLNAKLLLAYYLHGRQKSKRGPPLQPNDVPGWPVVADGSLSRCSALLEAHAGAPSIRVDELDPRDFQGSTDCLGRRRRGMHATSLELAHIGDASSRRGCELSLRPAKEGAGGAALGWYHHQCLGVAAVTTETDEVDVEFSTNDGGGWKKLIDGDSLGFVADRGARDRAKRRMDQGSPRLGDGARNPFPLHRNGRW